MDMKIAGRVALVTGGARGLGARICERLAAEGAKVVVADLAADGAEAQAAAIRAEGGQAVATLIDVTDAASIERALEATTSAFGGGVDILVNNAGLTRDMRINKMTEADWDIVVDVSLKGAFLCTKAVSQGMIDRGWGRVINMSSRAHLGNKGQANYSAAKAGLIGFTRAMALELGAFDITVNAVAPGMIDTQALRDLAHYADIIERAKKNTPIRRVGQPDDIAAAVVYLASDLAGYVTGEVLHVTGGRYG